MTRAAEREDTQRGAAARGTARAFASLRHRDFALLWTNSAFMSAGQWLQQVSLSWLIFEMTGSAFSLGLINGLRTLPFLFTGLISGAMADRIDRRQLLLGIQVYLTAVTLIIALLLLSGRAEAWHLYVFSFASGIGWSFIWPVRQAVVPTMVPANELLRAMALMMMAMNLMRVVGPAVGGFLLALLGGGGNFMVQVVFYALGIFMIGAMRIPPLATNASERAKNVWGSTMEGLRYVRTNEIVVTLLLMAVVPMILAMPFQSLLPIFAGKVYDIGPGGLGILFSFGGVGSLLGTLALASAGDLHRKGLLQFVALAAMGVSLALFAQSPWLSLAIVFLVVLSAFQMTYVTVVQTMLQASITDDMRGRVASLHMLDWGLVPAGSFAAGGLAEVIGAPNTITIMGALVTAIAIVAALRLKNLRNL